MRLEFRRRQSFVVEVKRAVFRQIFSVVSIEIFRRERQETRCNFPLVQVMAVGLKTFQENFSRLVVTLERLLARERFIKRAA